MQQEAMQQPTTPRVHRKERRRASDVPVVRTRVMSPLSAANVSRRRLPRLTPLLARPRANLDPGSLRQASHSQGALPPSHRPAGPPTLPKSLPPTLILALALAQTTLLELTWCAFQQMRMSNMSTRPRPSSMRAIFSMAGLSTLAPRRQCVLTALGSLTSPLCLGTLRSSLVTTVPSLLWALAALKLRCLPMENGSTPFFKMCFTCQTYMEIFSLSHISRGVAPKSFFLVRPARCLIVASPLSLKGG